MLSWFYNISNTDFPEGKTSVTFTADIVGNVTDAKINNKNHVNLAPHPSFL